MAMYRPIHFLDNNTYSFILMRNRSEELIEIPKEYIKSIEFGMGQYVNDPISLTMDVPSIIDRMGEKFEFPLFSMIKGKMQILMTINDKSYILDITEISEKENKDYTTKTVKAQERHQRLKDLDVFLTTGTSIATRQLYKPDNETVEISEGMLNLFCQQCHGWKVGEVSDLARKELILCSVKNNVYFQKVDKVITDEIFNESINVNIGDRPIYAKVNFFCKIYDRNNKLYLDTTVTCTLPALGYPIKAVKAKYVSTKKNFYGVEITITHTNGFETVEEFPFVNCKDLRFVSDISLEYDSGVLENQWTTKYRTFDSSGAKWNTMLENIAKSFDCVFLLDSYTQTINAYHYSEFGEDTGISLLYDNAIKEITRTRKLDELVTRLWVESSKVTIAGVNVLGTDYVENYDYFINSGIMSDELMLALDRYENLLGDKEKQYNLLIIDKYEADQNVTLAESQLYALEERLEGQRAILTGYLKDAADNGEAFNGQTQAQQKIVSDLEQQIKNKQTELDGYKATANNLQQQIVQIGIDIQKANAEFNGQKIFNDDLLLELSDYLIEKTLEDETHLTGSSLYNFALQEIQDYQKPIIDFTIATNVEFIKRAGCKITDFLYLGAKVGIEDRTGELADEDGTVMVYSFSLNPNKDEFSNFKFTNFGKAPDTALKQISRTTQTVKAAKSLTDFYKATWADMKNKALDIDEILTYGLDLAAQKVRSRTEENVLDISEAGIFCIDAKNNNEQLAIMNDLITMTTDGWRTAKVAISPEGVMADTIIGNLIMGSELYISNTKDTTGASFHINEKGFQVKDYYGTQQIFFGLYENKPWFIVGRKENNNYMQWWNGQLDIQAASIKIGASKVATNDDLNSAVNGLQNSITSSFEIEYNKIRMYIDDTSQQLRSLVEVTNGQIQMYVDNTSQQLRSLIEVTNGQITASVNDKINNLQAQINVNSNGISTKVSKGDIVSSINQSAENIKIKASKIDLNGTVTVTGNNRHIKIEDANYGVFDGNIRKAYLGFRGVSGTDYVVPKFVLSATNTEGVAHEYFVVTPYKGNKENPQSTDYGYVDIAYHTNWYSASTGGDWSNVKLYANGDMRVSPIRKLEVTTNFSGGVYQGGYERLVAEFRSDNHTWYNGNLSVGAVVNRTNGNGLILIDQHDHLGRQAGVRIQCNDDGGHTFRPLTNGECYNGTSNYRWKQIYAVKSTIATSDKRHKIIFGNMNSIDCYEMIKNIPLYNYYMLGENKKNLTKEEIEERMTEENKQMGLMAQDLIPYECGEYILDYQDDTYGINEYQLIQATIGALQEEIKLRDEQINELKQDIEYLKKAVINND